MTHLSDRPYDACHEWRDSVMAGLTGEKRPEAVIISNFTVYPLRYTIPQQAITLLLRRQIGLGRMVQYAHKPPA